MKPGYNKQLAHLFLLLAGLQCAGHQNRDNEEACTELFRVTSRAFSVRGGGTVVYAFDFIFNSPISRIEVTNRSLKPPKVALDGRTAERETFPQGQAKFLGSALTRDDAGWLFEAGETTIDYGIHAWAQNGRECYLQKPTVFSDSAKASLRRFYPAR